MKNKYSYLPKWNSPPGDTIIDILNHKSISVNEFSQQAGFSHHFTKDLLHGKQSITPNIAEKLEFTLGGSSEFWLNREAQFYQEKIRVKSILPDANTWLKNLPINEMTKFGWINNYSDFSKKVKSCFDFFEIENIEEWHYKYEDILSITAFRKSSSENANKESIISWIRQGEIVSKSISCKPWNPQLLSDSLIELRKLSQKKDPHIFIPKIQTICAESGVAVSVHPTPTKCPISGATLFTEPNQAILLLSFRYLSDDHFWFSFFHEIAHLLLHSKTNIFLEGIEANKDKYESEANIFAANLLIPPIYKKELTSFTVNDWQKIVRFAIQIGTSPGIVVGQLQKLGILKYNQLNRLKRKYTWQIHSD